MIVNGEVVAPFEGTIEEFVRERGAPERGIAIAIDGDVIPRSQWAATTLAPDANVEIVTASAGG